MKKIVILLFLCCMTMGISAGSFSTGSVTASHKPHHPKKAMKARAHMAQRELRAQR